MATQTYSYIAFHSTTFDTSVSYASNLMYLGKKDIISAAAWVGLSLPTSYTREKMAGALSEYVLANPERMLAMLDAEEVLLVQELMAAGKNGVVWKRHLLKYHTLKRMVWVLQNYDKSSRKDGFVMVDELREAFAPFIEYRAEEAARQLAEKKKKKKEAKKAELEGRLSLGNLKARLRKLDVERLKIVHFQFMRHHIDFCSYSFEDEWLLDGYCMCYNDWLSQEESDEPCPLDGYVIDVLKEWKRYDYSLYSDAIRDLESWMETDWTDFTSVHRDRVKQAWKDGMIGEDEKVLAQHLLPFVDEVKALILKEEYQEAVSMLFCLFDCLGRTNVLHEDWFESFLDTCEMNHITLCLSKLRYLYCHLRQHDGLSRDYKYDMDMHLMITNYTHGLFGCGCELDFCSLTADMVCDREEQYSSYQNLSEDIMGYEFDNC